ncbi:MAG: HNH endonuclease signature motif containing protein [Sporolactobacillus sp.]
MGAQLFTQEQAQFLKNRVLGRGNDELATLLNKHFGLSLSRQQIKNYKSNHNLSSGLDGRYKPGHVPANKGTHTGGWEPTQFKKGHRPANYMPVGTEKMKSDGYVYVKIADPGKWRQKHRLIWEKANGPIPKGHKLLFGDGNHQNIDLDNLILVTNRQVATLNKLKLIQKNAALTKSGLLVAELHSKLYRCKQQKRKHRRSMHASTH